MDTLIGGRRARLWVLLAVLGMIVALVFTGPATDAIGQEDGVDIQEDAGIILLSTGSGNNWIRYYADPQVPGPGQGFADVNPTPTAQQALNVGSQCTVSSNNSILVVSQTGGRRVTLVSNGLGVGAKNNCSTSEGRVSDGQRLTFALSNTSAFQDVSIETVEVDVEAKFGTDLRYTIDNDATVRVYDLTKGQDNGPDAGASDNEIAVIDQDATGSLFTSISLFPDSGKELSIEGGGDGQVDGGGLRSLYKVNQTLFKLVSGKTFDAGDLSCGDSSTGTAAPAENGPALAIELTRGDNLKTEECADLAYSFRIESDVVLFDADFEAQPDAQFLIRIEWDPADPIVDPFNPPDREVDVELDGSFASVEACDGRTSENPSSDPSISDTFLHAENTPWCLAGEKLVLLEDGTWQQIQWYHGAGDPQFR